MSMDTVEPWNSVASGISMSIALPVTVLILSRESWKRKDSNLILPSKWQAVFSYLSLCVGPIYVIVSFLRVSDILYSAALASVVVLFTAQTLFMEYDQLSRLHYCFSRDRVHSESGYPKWLFIAMYSAATLSAVFFIVSSLVSIWRTDLDRRLGLFGVVTSSDGTLVYIRLVAF